MATPSGVLLVSDPVPPASDVAAAGAVNAFLLGIGGFDSPVIELHHLYRYSIGGALGVVGNDHFFENDLVIFELVAARAAECEFNFLEMLACAAGFHQFATGTVEKLGEGEMADDFSSKASPGISSIFI